MHIKKNAFHLPFHIKIDLTKLANKYEQAGRPVPYTAVLIKAAAMLAKARPSIHRMVVKTFYGLRMIEFENPAVNVPIYIPHGNRKYLTAAVIKDAHTKSIAQIRSEIRSTKRQPVEKLMINRFFIRNRNHLLNRLRLRLLHFFAYNFPGAYEKRGGGITVSSLIGSLREGESPTLTPIAFGPNCLTLCASSIEKGKDGSVFLNLGVGLNHICCSGEEAVVATHELSKILHESVHSFME
jgi:hypothetical protein